MRVVEYANGTDAIFVYITLLGDVQQQQRRVVFDPEPLDAEWDLLVSGARLTGVGEVHPGLIMLFSWVVEPPPAVPKAVPTREQPLAMRTVTMLLDICGKATEPEVNTEVRLWT